MKYEYVPDKYDGIEVKEYLHIDCISYDGINVADNWWKRSQNVTNNDWNLNKEIPTNSNPNQ